jgi:hypothetical protein
MLREGAGHSSGVCAAAATGMSEVLPALLRGVAKLATDMLDYVVYYTSTLIEGRELCVVRPARTTCAIMRPV